MGKVADVPALPEGLIVPLQEPQRGFVDQRGIVTQGRATSRRAAEQEAAAAALDALKNQDKK